MAYDTDNIFAKILRGELPAHVVHEDERTVAILDVMPQADGHTLILPRAAAEDFFTLTDPDAAAVMRAGRVVAEALRKAFDADGIRVMQFNGEAAGQTVFHYHLHLIPCHRDQGLRSHARGMADPDVLAGHAERIRAALTRD
jgi:histidine triad (HIT) family protein